MKKALSIFSIALVSILLLFYIVFLITPIIFNSCYDLNKHKTDIQKIVKDNAKLNLEYSKIKIFTTPLLSIGAEINDLDVTFYDKSTLIKTSKFKGGISLPSLLTLTIKTAQVEINNPEINLDIVDDKQYKIITLVQNILKENELKPKKAPTQQSEFVEKLAKKIKIKVPNVLISDYQIKANDLKNKHYLDLKGEKLSLGYNSSKNSIKIRTNAKLYSDTKENVNANIDVKAFLGKSSKKEDKKTQQQNIEIPFVNIVKMYQAYDFKANIDTKLKIKIKKNIKLFGYFNIDDCNLKISNQILPKGYLHAIFDKTQAKFDSNAYVKDNQKISLNGELNYGKNKKLNSIIKTDKIYFSDLKNLAMGLLNSLNIKNDLAKINMSGYLLADTKINTDFKKLKSNGSIIVDNGSLKYNELHLNIEDIFANLLFNDNALNIKDTSLIVNNSKVDITGLIDSNSNTDIKINANHLPLSELYQTFAPKEIKENYILNNAKLSANAFITGKLDNLKANLKMNLDNLNIKDSKNTLLVQNKNLNLNYDITSKDAKGELINNGFKISMPKLNTTGAINNLKINIQKDDIIINPFDFIYNNLSKINVNGKIEDFVNKPTLDIFMDGKINTQNLKATLGKDFANYFNGKGIIPAKISIKGDLNTQNIIAQIYADNNNYFTPINIMQLKNASTLAHADVKIQGNKIKIKNSGLFKTNKQFNNNLNANISNTSKIADFSAILEGENIHSLKLNIPEELKMQIAMFKNSSLNAKGKISISGKAPNLNYGGDIKISNLNIPELLIKTQQIDLDFISKGLDVTAKNANINGSTLDGSMKLDLRPSKIIKINNINVKGNDLNVDKMMKVLDMAMKCIPQPKPSSKQVQQANIPLNADGVFDIKSLQTGNIIITNIKGNFNIKNNNLYITNLICNAFKGEVDGNITMNLISTLMSIKLNGKNLDANEALVKAANMKDTISGNLKFKTDISLKGMTYLEQVKSLKGNAIFELKNGQYGPFAKIENILLAQNIRENAIFKNTLGTILTPLATVDTSRYEKLTGRVDFNNGVVTLNSIKSQGDILCALITGKMNLVTNRIDAKARVRLASKVSDMLGPIAVANPVNLIKGTPGLNVASAKLFSIFSESTNKTELNEIPNFSKNYSDKNATKFQIILNGDVAKPLTIVKSFKWLVSEDEMNKAKEFSTDFVKTQEEALKKQLSNTLQKTYETSEKFKTGVDSAIKANETANKIKNTINNKEQITQNAKDNLKAKNEAIKKGLEEKAQQAIQNKLQSSKDAFRLKMQEKLNANTATPAN